ncbi:GL20884 [Drosophila persimilis]|uniref:GL20884 n=1 Tax=Drosophila persimilis TaxID=7234 RepID=B4H9A2_DROPE|nr:GL20884 [Drosophila persimilis]
MVASVSLGLMRVSKTSSVWKKPTTVAEPSMQLYWSSQQKIFDGTDPGGTLVQPHTSDPTRWYRTR